MKLRVCALSSRINMFIITERTRLREEQSRFIFNATAFALESHLPALGDYRCCRSYRTVTWVLEDRVGGACGRGPSSRSTGNDPICFSWDRNRSGIYEVTHLEPCQYWSLGARQPIFQRRVVDLRRNCRPRHTSNAQLPTLRRGR